MVGDTIVTGLISNLSVSRPMAADLIPVVDLGVMSQSDIAALASASAPYSAWEPDLAADPPKIDRSIFNESAGSRKQTYFRLRLAPRDPSLPRRRGRPRSVPTPESAPAPAADPTRQENRIIISFLRQLFTHNEPPPQTPDHDQLTPFHNAGVIHQDEIAKPITLPPFSITAEHGKQQGPFMVDNPATEQKCFTACHNCNLSFDNKDAHMQHVLSSHKRNTKRRKLGKTIGDGVIIKDGKYECQYCHKTFTEKRGYYGHVGTHVRYQGLTAEAMPEDATRKIADASSLAATPSVLCKMNSPFKKNEENDLSETCCAKPVHEKGLTAEAMPEDTTRKSADASSLSATPSVLCEMNAPFKKNEGKNPSETFCAKPVDEMDLPSSHCRLEMDNTEMDLNTKRDLPEISKFTMSIFLDDNAQPCDPAFNKFEELGGSGNIINFRSNTSNAVIRASSIDVSPMMQDFSPKVTQDAAIDESVGAEINSNIADYKTEEVSEVHKIKGDDPASYMVDKSFHVNRSDADNDVLNEKSVSTSTLKFDGNDISLCNTIDKAEQFPNCSLVSEDTTPNECSDALPPSLINANNGTWGSSNEIDLSSCAVNDEIEKYGEHQKVGSESNLVSSSGNGVTYGVETFMSNVYSNLLGEVVIVGIDTPINEIECGSGSGPNNTIMLGSLQDELHTNNEQEINLPSCVLSLFGDDHDQDIGINADRKFHTNMKEPFLEETNQPGSVLEQCFTISTAGCCDIVERGTIENDAGADAMQIDAANTSSSWIQPTPGPSILDMIPDQCEDVPSLIGQKHKSMSGFEMGVVHPSNLDLFSGQELTSVSESHLELGLIGQMENQHQPTQQIEWDLSATIDGITELTSVCVWCSREFSHEGVNAELQSDSLGFVCPACKAKI